MILHVVMLYLVCFWSIHAMSICMLILLLKYSKILRNRKLPASLIHLQYFKILLLLMFFFCSVLSEDHLANNIGQALLC